MALFFIVFVLLFEFCVFVDLFLKRKSKFFAQVVAIVMLVAFSVFEGCRDVSVGYDASFYGLPVFRATLRCDDFGYLYKIYGDWMGFFYLALNNIVAFFSDSIHVMLAVVCFLCSAPFLWGCMNLHNKLYFPALFFIISLYLFMGAQNILRQSIAASILFYAFSLINGKYGGWKFLFFSLIAVLAHKTAIPMIIAILWGNYTQYVPIHKRTKYLVVTIAAVVIVVAGLAAIMKALSDIPAFERFQTYANSKGAEGWRKPVIPTIVLAYHVVSLGVILFLDLKAKLSRQLTCQYYILIIISTSIVFLGTYTGSMLRLLIYSVPIVVALHLNLISESRLLSDKTKVLIYMFNVCFFILVFFRMVDETLFYKSDIIGI